MIDDSILVELGMEIDYLAGRAALARERLGKETTEELAVFIIAAKRYTLRLSVVQRYEERLAPLHTSVEAGAGALDTLSSFASSSDVLTAQAKGRLEDLTQISKEDLGIEHAQGLVISVENLVAEAGGEIVSALSAASGEAIKKGGAKLGEKAAEGAAKILIKHGPDVYRIITERGAEWMSVVMSAIEHLFKQ